MNVADNLERLKYAKSKIRLAIEGKGVQIPDSVKLDEYSAYIDSIENSGGGKQLMKIPNGITLSGSSMYDIVMSDWDWSCVYDWSYMFEGCYNLCEFRNSPQLKGNCEGMFKDCQGLRHIELDITDCISLKNIFEGCFELEEITFYGKPNIDASYVDDFADADLFGLMGSGIDGTMYYPSEYEQEYKLIRQKLPLRWDAIPK